MNIYIQNHIIQETDAHMTRHIVYGEIALIVAVCINSFAVVLMLYSGAGISAISSVPYAFSEVLPKLSLGTWTYNLSGTSGSHPDDFTEEICPSISVQFYRWFFLRETA